ncbi:mitochondrial splicing system protein [Myotisia sp. PD_48]|nr:mitochondrial splicing system protein [Myotisia sp. PD_48]
MRRFPIGNGGIARAAYLAVGNAHRQCRPRFHWHSTPRPKPQKAQLPAEPRRCMAFATNEGSSTIYALSTAPGRAAIAIIRVSGPACVQRFPKPRFATLRTLYDPSQSPSRSSILDSGALIFYFPAPKTVTGEDVLELHIHGSPAVVKSVLNAIPRCTVADSPVAIALHKQSPIRYAEAGEFTRRAFLNDRLDLPQIEALGSTLAADTEQQRRLAIRGTSDSLSVRYEQWRQQLLYARGELEALIDFSEDQHFDESVEEFVTSVAAQVQSLLYQINLHITNASKGELLRNGIRVALLGAPNAGKSSLLNQIVGREAAIVSSEEGTTRDVVDVGVDLGGWLCKFGDTAGLRSDIFLDGAEAKGNFVPIGKVEKEGIRRAKARALDSDLVIVVLSLEKVPGEKLAQLIAEPEVISAAKICLESNKNMVVAINKTDKLLIEETRESSQGYRDGPMPNYTQKASELLGGIDPRLIFPISCQEAQGAHESIIPLKTRDPGGIQALLSGLIREFEEMSTPVGLEERFSATGENGHQNIQSLDKSYWEDSLGVTHRQSSNLQICAQHLEDFLTQTIGNEARTPDNANANNMDETENKNHTKQNIKTEIDIDIVTAAEHLRYAAESLAKITGRGEGGDVESVLGVVFEKYGFLLFLFFSFYPVVFNIETDGEGRFCVGK